MRRIIKAARDAEAGAEITRFSSRLSGSRNSFFYTDESGCYIVGPVSILAEPQDIRIAAAWTLPTAYEAALPSTSVTPRPILTPSSPVEGFAELAAEVSRLLGELL